MLKYNVSLLIDDEEVEMIVVEKSVNIENASKELFKKYFGTFCETIKINVDVEFITDSTDEIESWLFAEELPTA